MDEDEEYTEEDYQEIPPVSWTKEASLVSMLNMAAAQARAVADFFEQSVYQAAADSNSVMSTKRFHEQAAMEIETLTTPED